MPAAVLVDATRRRCHHLDPTAAAVRRSISRTPATAEFPPRPVASADTMMTGPAVSGRRLGRGGASSDPVRATIDEVRHEEPTSGANIISTAIFVLILAFLAVLIFGGYKLTMQAERENIPAYEPGMTTSTGQKLPGR